MQAPSFGHEPGSHPSIVHSPLEAAVGAHPARAADPPLASAERDDLREQRNNE
jgi:hypothetical protein